MLYIVATPIGNLDDMSSRAITVLQTVDLVVCEDTRVTAKLLDRYQIKTKTLSYHHHSSLTVLQTIVDHLQNGMSIAYVSDAGTPGISDPGNKLVAHVTKQLPRLRIVPIPGPSATITALSICGFPTDNFVFKGFIPHKKGRQTFLASLVQMTETVVFFESVHRIEKLLDQMHEVLPNRNMMVARELTKQFETVYRGTAAQIKAQLIQDPIKGEFVIVVQGNGHAE